MKTNICQIAMGIMLIILLIGCGGGGGGSDEGAPTTVTPQAVTIAEEIADDIIASEYPDFSGIAPAYQGYENQGRFIHSFLYMRTFEYEYNGSIVKIPSNVVVNVDQDSGETEIFLSN